MRTIKIELQIYNAIVHINRWTQKELEAKQEQLNKEYDVEIDWNSENSIWGLFQIGGQFFIFIEWKESYVLVHELYHLVNKLYVYIWLPIDEYNDEFWAYMIGYLYKKASWIFK